jgi:hypothetical protein
MDMEQWKLDMEELVNKDRWSDAIQRLANIIKQDSNNVEATVYLIYVFHNVLLEVNDERIDKKQIAHELKKLFNESNEQFSNSPEYLFFVGSIVYIAEWYFGIDEDRKEIRSRLAFRMQYKAYELEPANDLYQWGFKFSLSLPDAPELARKILEPGSIWPDWLNSRGLPGKYILEKLNKCGKAR